MQQVIVRFNASYDDNMVIVSVGFSIPAGTPEEDIIEKAMTILASEDASQPAIIDEVMYL